MFTNKTIGSPSSIDSRLRGLEGWHNSIRFIITQMKNPGETCVCAICGNALIVKRIDYIDSNDGQFLVVRNVPVQECVESGHQFMDAAAAKEIEKIFELDRLHLLKPEQTISVPVVELEMSV